MRIEVVLATLAIARIASAEPEKVTIVVTDLERSFGDAAVTPEDVIIPLGERRELVERCLNRRAARVEASGVARMTVANGVVVRVRVDGLGAAAACVKKYRGVRLWARADGSFAVRVVVEAVAQPEPVVETIPIVDPSQKMRWPMGAKAVEAKVVVVDQTENRAAIAAVMKANAGPFRACYQRKAPIGGGRLEVRFVVVRGRVTTVHVTQSFHGGVDECIVRTIRRLAFPAIDAVVNFPFVFGAKGGTRTPTVLPTGT